MKLFIREIVPIHPVLLALDGALIPPLDPACRRADDFSVTTNPVGILRGKEPVFRMRLALSGSADASTFKLEGRRGAVQFFSGGSFEVPRGGGEATVEIALQDPDSLPQWPGLMEISWTATAASGETAEASTPLEIYLFLSDPWEHSPAGVPLGLLRELARSEIPAGKNAGPFALRDLPTAKAVQMVADKNIPYDTYSGRPAFTSLYPPMGLVYFDFAAWEAAGPSEYCNCYDTAACVWYYCKLGIGGPAALDSFFTFIKPFGYLKKTELIGRGVCNNPFYGNANYSDQPVCAVDDPRRSGFSNHSYVLYRVSDVRTQVMDACVGPHYGNETWVAYTDDSMDSQTPQPPAILRGQAQNQSYYLELLNQGLQPAPLSLKEIGEDARCRDFIARFQPLPQGEEEEKVFLAWPRPELWFQGARLVSSRLIPGYPLAVQKWSFEKNGKRTDLEISVSSDGRHPAISRFVDLGINHQLPPEGIERGPAALGPYSLLFPSLERPRYVWVKGNVVYDVASRDIEGLPALLAWLNGEGAALSQAVAGARVQTSVSHLKLGGRSTVVLESAPDARVEILSRNPGLRLVKREGSTFQFYALRPMEPGSIQFVVTDPRTLRSQMVQTEPIFIQED